MSSRIAKSHPAMTPGTRDDPRRPSAVEHWTEHEIDESVFKDARLGRRFGELLKQIGDGMGESIPYACQDWANTKAAYRFFANGRVEEGDILSGHFAATRARCDGSDGPILLIQDTTEFSYQRASVSAVGVTKSVNSGRDKRGRLRHHTVCGMLMHSSLAVTAQGLPLGLAAVKFWTRKKFRGTAALKKKINPTRVPIEKKESVRWLDNLRQSLERLGQPERYIHVGDRESAFTSCTV
jgi:Transposase DNA-binding